MVNAVNSFIHSFIRPSIHPCIHSSVLSIYILICYCFFSMYISCNIPCWMIHPQHQRNTPSPSRHWIWGHPWCHNVGWPWQWTFASLAQRGVRQWPTMKNRGKNMKSTLLTSYTIVGYHGWFWGESSNKNLGAGGCGLPLHQSRWTKMDREGFIASFKKTLQILVFVQIHHNKSKSHNQEWLESGVWHTFEKCNLAWKNCKAWNQAIKQNLRSLVPTPCHTPWELK